MKTYILASMALLASVLGCSDTVEKLNTRTATSTIEDAAESIEFKILENKIQMNKADSLSLVSSLPTASISAAVGHVAGCVDDPSILAVSGMELSIQVPFDCANEVILIDRLDLNFSGLSGVIKLTQGQPVFINEEYGSVILSNLQVVRIGGSFKKTADIEIDGKVLQSTISIDGSDSACEDLQVVQSGSTIDLKLIGTFPVAVQYEQSENLSFGGSSTVLAKTNAIFRATIPATTGTALYSGKLTWTDSQLNKFCSFDVSVNFKASAVANVAANENTGCPFSAEQLWNQDHLNYCTYDRLSAVEVPSVCSEGERLLITTTTGSEGTKIITLAKCQ